jgi:hypothetical protein
MRNRFCKLIVGWSIIAAGCSRAAPTPPATGPATVAPPAAVAAPKQLGKNVYFEVLPDGRRRVLVEGYVSLREGDYGLECLLCRRGTKEHESVLAVDADARAIHAGLTAAGATPGAPVQFTPEFKSPTGTPIQVSLRYARDGKTVTIPARDWVREAKTGKELDHDWVFAGSYFYKDPDEPNREPLYVASADGAYICVTSVPTALLDLPIFSPKGLEERAYVPWTERIPALGTKVTIILEPAPANKEN